jgi:hypothetical protein
VALDFALEPEQETLMRPLRAFAQRERAPRSGDVCGRESLPY